MKKRIRILAYANFNLGDDLFIKILCERYPETRFILYAPKEYKQVLHALDNVSVLSDRNVFTRLFHFAMKKLRKNLTIHSLIAGICDATVQIGGSIFMQHDDWTGIPKQKQPLFQKPFFIIGANFGPYRDKQFYDEHRNMFSRCTDICFRDEYSYALFSDLPNVRRAGDIVFQLTHHRSSPKTVSKNTYIIISVIKPSFRKNLGDCDHVYYEKIKDIAVYFAENGFHIILMSFCMNEGDSEAAERIMKLLPKDVSTHVTAYHYQKNINAALDVIEASEYVVATRFHAMVLGWIFHKPVFPIIYSSKMTNVMKDIGYSGSCIDLTKIHTLKPAEVYRGMETNHIDVAAQVEQAENHFKKLDAYLMGSSSFVLQKQ